MMYDHNINCGIHDDPGASDCTCGFDPTLPMDEVKLQAVAYVTLFFVSIFGLFNLIIYLAKLF